jgi:hypothetical protein
MDNIEFPLPGGKGDSISPYLPMSDSRLAIPTQWDFPVILVHEVGMILINGGRGHVTQAGWEWGAALQLNLEPGFSCGVLYQN